MVGVVLASVLTAAQATPASPPLEPAFVAETVMSLATVIDREYMDAEVAARVAASLRMGVREGRYAAPLTPDALATRLTRDLYETTRDKHLAVAVVAERAPSASEQAQPVSREIHVRRTNAGIRKLEVLAGNVGYLELTSFFRPEEAREALAAAMRLLRDADALILDLRRNGGGNTDTAALFLGYFFAEPGLELFQLVPRSGESRVYRTDGAGLPDRDGKRPIYALTAKRTFSAGEGVAFLLQERRRAVVVGETTAGAANPGRPYPVNARFEVTVPNGRVKSAVRGGNWEGVGVEPDVAVPAETALRVAHARALVELMKSTSDAAWRERLAKELAALDQRR